MFGIIQYLFGRHDVSHQAPSPTVSVTTALQGHVAHKVFLKNQEPAKYQEYLKVKVCSLAAEARIIRRQEERVKRRARRGRERLRAAGNTKVGSGLSDADRDIWHGLRSHRTGLRTDLRHAHLAYGFLRGRKYRQMEQWCLEEPDWDEVQDLVVRYRGKADDREIRQHFSEWLQGIEDRTVLPSGKVQFRKPPSWNRPKTKVPRRYTSHYAFFSNTMVVHDSVTGMNASAEADDDLLSDRSMKEARVRATETLREVVAETNDPLTDEDMHP